MGITGMQSGAARGRRRWIVNPVYAAPEPGLDNKDSEILPLNSIYILGLQIPNSLFWRNHIVQIAKSVSKKLGVLFQCKQYFNFA